MANEDVGKLYPIAKAVLTPVFRAAWKFDLQGLDNVPADGPAILCPNHTSVLDSFFVPALLPRRVTYVGKAEYMDDWKTRRLFPALGMIPIDREGGDAGEVLHAATVSGKLHRRGSRRCFGLILGCGERSSVQVCADADAITEGKALDLGSTGPVTHRGLDHSPSDPP